MSDEKLTIYVNFEHTAALNGLIICCEKKFDIRYDESVAENMIEISKDVGFLIFNQQNLPRKIEDLGKIRPVINEFIDKYEHAIIIIQGFFEMNIDPIVRLAILGAMIKVFLDENKGILPTRNLKDTRLCLKSIAKRVQIIDKPPLLARLKEKKSKNLFDDQMFLIEGLAQMGEKKSKELAKHFKSPIEIIEEIKSSELIHTKTGNPKGVSGKFGEIKGFSYEFIKQNKELLFADL